MNKIESQNNLLIYQNKNSDIVVAIYKDETLWLTQKSYG